MAYNVAANMRPVRPGAAFIEGRDNALRNALAEQQAAQSAQAQQFNQNRATQQDQAAADERAQAGEQDERKQVFNYLSHLSRAKSPEEFSFLANKMAATDLFRRNDITLEDLTPEEVAQSLPMFAAEAGQAPAVPEKPEAFTLSPGQRRFVGGNEVASVDPIPPSASERPSLVDVTLPDGSVQQQWLRPGQASGTPVGAPKPASSGPSMRDVTSLRKEFESTDSAKQYRAVLPLFNRAKTAPDSRAGDISIIYALGKMFDPTSVVREGELVLAQNAAPWLVKMASQANSQLTSKGQLLPQTRAAIMEALQGQVESFKIPYTQERARYSQYATEYGIDPFKVVGNDAAEGFDTAAPASPSIPKVGEVRKGYRFKGGDPAQPSSWEQVR
jgi:hypothetical protein